MAIDEDGRDAASAEEADESGASRGTIKWVVIGVLALLLLGGVAAAVYFLVLKDDGSEAPADAPAAAETTAPEPEPEYEAPEGAEPIYFPISPALTVNFSQPTNSGKYLQVLMEVMSRDREVIEALKDNLPAIRNDLILLLGEQQPAVIRTAAGKQKLQRDCVRTMQRTLARENARLAQGIEAVYFTKFVIQ